MTDSSTTAAKPIGTCWRCGGVLYHLLAHSCTTNAAAPPPHATPDRAANLNSVLVRQLAATILRVRAHGHGTREGAAIDLIQEMWDLGWDITPRLDTIGSKRERERRSSR